MVGRVGANGCLRRHVSGEALSAYRVLGVQKCLLHRSRGLTLTIAVLAARTSPTAAWAGGGCPRWNVKSSTARARGKLILVLVRTLLVLVASYKRLLSRRVSFLVFLVVSFILGLEKV